MGVQIGREADTLNGNGVWDRFWDLAQKEILGCYKSKVRTTKKYLNVISLAFEVWYPVMADNPFMNYQG